MSVFIRNSRLQQEPDTEVAMVAGVRDELLGEYAANWTLVWSLAFYFSGGLPARPVQFFLASDQREELFPQSLFQPEYFL